MTEITTEEAEALSYYIWCISSFSCPHQSGDIDIVNTTTKDTCRLKFSPYSYFSREVPRKVCFSYRQGIAKHAVASSVDAEQKMHLNMVPTYFPSQYKTLSTFCIRSWVPGVRKEIRTRKDWKTAKERTANKGLLGLIIVQRRVFYKMRNVTDVPHINESILYKTVRGFFRAAVAKTANKRSILPKTISSYNYLKNLE